MSTLISGAGKRAIACVVMTVALIASCLPVMPTQAWADTEPTPSSSKTVTRNADGTYDIKLSVTGAMSHSQETEYNAADVVVVLDISNSMFDNNDPYNHQPFINNARSSIRYLANSLLTAENASLPEGQQVKMSLVTYGNYAGDQQVWTTTASQIISAADSVQRPGTDGGTNWEDGINHANALDSGRNAKKYIVFLSDGEPTLCVRHYVFRHNYNNVIVPSEDYVQRYRDPSYEFIRMERDGNGISIDISEINRFAERGAAAANRRNKANDQFYAVSVQTIASNRMSTLASSSDGRFLDGTDHVKLNEAFDEIIKEIRKTYKFQKVSILDTLSDHVEFAGPDAISSISVTKKTSAGVETPWTDTTPTISGGNKVRWDIGDYHQLEVGSTYTMTIKVRPKQATFDAAADGALPDDGEGAQSGQKGFRTNAEGTLLYHVNTDTTVTPGGPLPPTLGPEKQIAYEKPIITDVPQSQLTVAIDWNGREPSQTEVDAEIERDDGKVYAVKLTKDALGNWTTTTQLPAGLTGHTYTLRALDLGEDWALSYSAALDPASSTSSIGGEREIILNGLTEQKGAFTVTASYVPFGLTLTKQDKGDGTPLAGAKFMLYTDDDDNGVFDPLVDQMAAVYSDPALGMPVAGSLTTDPSGKASFYGLMPGKYWVVEVAAPSGYQLLSEMPLLSVTGTSSNPMTLKIGDGALSEVSVSGRVGSITVADEKIAVLPEASGPGVMWLYLAGIVAVAVACGALTVPHRRRAAHAKR